MKILDGGVNTVIVPIGTMEAHGPHLPVATDALIPIEISRRLEEEVNAFVAPPIYYGVTTSLSCYPGSIPVSKSSFTNYLYDILVGFAKSGFINVILINGHAGNTDSIKEAAERAYNTARVRIINIDWWILSGELIKKHFNVDSAGHAALAETSAILAINEKLVKRDLYDKRQEIQKRPGIWTYPKLGSIIRGEEGDTPDFDVKRSKDFFEDVCKNVEKVVIDCLKRASENPL